MMVTTLLSILCLTFWFSEAQVPIPTKPLGVHYRNGTHNAPIHIHVFLDLACPDSKMAWPIMKQVADAYPFGTISLKVFIFPLPYHRNAHLAAIGAHAAYSNPPAGMSRDNATLAYVTELFAKQSSWSDYSTRHSDYEQIESMVASYTTSIGYKADDFMKWLGNSDYDWSARVEWKYGCSRGVAGTPWYFINEVNVAADATWKVTKWKQVIDNLLNGRTLMSNI